MKIVIATDLPVAYDAPRVWQDDHIGRSPGLRVNASPNLPDIHCGVSVVFSVSLTAYSCGGSRRFNLSGLTAFPF